MARPTASPLADSAGKVNVLLVGGGGREHAIAAKLAASPRMGTLWVTHPDNPGLAALGRGVDVPVDIREIYRLVQVCDRERIGLVVIGPEDPLAEGYADKLAAPGRLVFGPTAAGARLEADKGWCKQLLRSAAIPTAESKSFSDAASAKAYIEAREELPVIKATGLAKGKGVVVPSSKAEALAAIDQMMVKRIFGDAGRTVLLEERLTGAEVSVLALVDGRTIAVLEVCQDHKRLGDGDTGPNTGGMGAFCPSALIDERMMARIEREILVPTVDALRRDGIDYRGVLFAGLMLTHGGPKVLEYNVRFGDPECQALLPRIRADLLEVMIATCERRLDEVEILTEPGATCCIVLASPGYPDRPRMGLPITGLDAAGRLPGVTVYHAGTARRPDGTIVTAGGRVLGVTAVGADLREARDRAYAAASLIDFEGKLMRSDIASGVLVGAG
jgi:phosphoribosylamine--glycine ligase